MKFKAINNYLGVELIKKEVVERGGILLPQTMERMPRWGRVFSVGPGSYDNNGDLIPCDVEEGQLAYCMAHGLYELYQNEVGERDNNCVVSVLDVLGVLDDEENMNFQPLGNYVTIEKIETKKFSESEILLPDTVKFPPNVGRVIKLGKGWKTLSGREIPFQVKEGDLVVFNPLQAMVVDFSGLGKDEKLTLLMHSDIIGVVEE